MPSPDHELILDAKSMRAIAHPVRIKIMGILRTMGPQNSTSLAERLGLNTGATSYHLRQLAEHGMIAEDTERGTGRERWWRAVSRSTRLDPETLDQEGLEQSTGFHRALALVYAEQMQRAVESIASEPEEWRKASTFSDFGLRLTAAEALRLRDEIFAVLQKYREHDAEDAPEDAQHFHVQIQAFRVEGH
ncbi:MAG: winged helix-turn-helix transcriptional regulator [Acidimicrobiales bacterium]|nr:winged helix-turn-helix transcriptional regulator [Acidimicrobiales bacterium]HLV90241.1 winged helix-turn-helix domain-containing protein [Acidimicrobiia bacterium]